MHTSMTSYCGVSLGVGAVNIETPIDRYFGRHFNVRINVSLIQVFTNQKRRVNARVEV